MDRAKQLPGFRGDWMMPKYWYSYRLRGPSIGAQPDDFLEWTDDFGRFGAVAYGRRLTAQEMKQYSLDAIACEIGNYTEPVSIYPIRR